MASTTDSLSHSSAVEYLLGRINYERIQRIPRSPSTFRLQRMHDLLERLGNPHVGLKVVHIAGTKGKGSTASFVSSILRTAGYRTGLFTSPHLHRLEERFTLDGEPCSSDDLRRLVAEAIPAVSDLDRLSELGQVDGKPTFFEITTAMAFLYFAQQNVDLAVVEVGLGGRLDSTNVCHPVASVITSISFDHMRLLGNTLESIAREKAGIIKPCVPVVCGVTEEESLRPIREAAKREGCPLLALGVDFDFDYQSPVNRLANGSVDAMTGASSVMSYESQPNAGVGQLKAYPEVELKLLGRHQAHNAALALAVAGILDEMGWSISDDARKLGVASTTCPTRVEVFSGRPTCVVDSAHNPASIRALIEAVEELMPSPWSTLVFATSVDKDANKMLRQVLPQFENVVLTQFVNNPRAFPLSELTQLADAICREDHISTNIVQAENPTIAWDVATKFCSDEAQILCVTGSTFISAEMRELILGDDSRSTR